MPDISPTLIERVQRMPRWQLWAGFTLLAILCAEVVVAVMGYLLLGRITADYLITGFAAALIAAPVSLVLLTKLLAAITREREQALQASAELAVSSLNLAVSTAQMMFWEYDVLRDRLIYDDEKIRGLGVTTTAEHHTFSGWLTLVHPNDREAFVARYITTMKPGGPDLDFEYRIAATSPGEWIWLHTRGRMVRQSEAGQPLWAVGGSINITVGKRAAIELAETRDRLQNIFNDNPDVMVISRLSDGVITDVNDAFLRAMGFSRSEALGTTTLALTVWDNPEDHERMMQALREKGHFTDYEAAFRAKDGLVGYGLVSAIVTHLQGVPHILNTVRNVNRRRRAEEALRKSETLLRSTLEASDEGILMISAKGQVLSANKRFMAMWRVPETLATAKEDGKLLAHVLSQLSDPNEFMREVNRLYGTEESARDTLHFKDGRVFTRFTQALHIGPERGRIWCFQDTTEQVNAQRALADREEIYRAIVTQASDGVVVVDMANQQFVEFNDAACAALGYSREEFARLGIPGIQAEHSQQMIEENLRRINETGGADFESLHRHKDGSLRNVRVSNRLMHLKGRNYLAAIVTDITDSKRVSQQMLEHSLFLATLLKAVPVPLFYKDAEGRYTGVNPAFEAFYGLPAASVLGKTVFELNPSELASVYHAHDQMLMREPTSEVYESLVRNHMGEDRNIVFHKASFTGADGRVHGLIGAAVDITEQRRTTQALQDSERRAHELATMLRMMCDNVPDMIWAKDLQRRFIFANKAACEQLLMATDTQEPVGKDDIYFAQRQRAAHPERADWHTFGELCQDSDAVTLEKNCPAQFDEYGNVQGEFMFLDVHKAPFVNDSGQVIGVVGSGRNVTQQRKAEERLKLASLVLETSSEALIITDNADRIVDINPAFTRLTGYTLAEVAGKNPSLFHSGQQGADFYAEMWKRLEVTGHWQGEIWNQRKNGEVFAEWLNINTIYHDDGRVHRRVGLFSDITERKRSEELIWSQANFDALTQLPNRRMFRDRLMQDLKKAQRGGLRLALLFLDLDRFKEVNDTLGHEQGDVLLVEAARRIVACVRASDTVARLGGDEFTIILAELEDANVAERVAGNILDTLQQPFQLGHDVAWVSASIGITLCPDDSTNLEDLIKNADQAMYVAKGAGRNRFCYFTRAMQDAALERIALLNDLHMAVKEQQFELVYQPIVSLASGHIGKAEALLRWRHPVRGVVSPAVFIALAEESGLIHEIGDWVFTEAARQVQRWQGTVRADFQVSVNVSPLQIQAARHPGQWVRALQEMGLRGNSMVLEITEGLLLDSSNSVAEQLLAFRDAGIQVAIDDFGTGYSALSYLKKLDIDTLKIDQSFIRNLGSEASDMALSEAIVVMAHKLGLRVVAEGVETALQRDLLRAMGCDDAQGYLYARPLPASELEPLLQAALKAE